MNLRALYAALKPERTYANVMMTAAAFLFACRWHIHWALFVYTLLGTTLIVMSACAVNNVTDRRLDAQMPRTKKRATATGELAARRLTIVAIVLGLVGFAVLALHVNWLTVLVGAIGYIDYAVFYAWTKRTTIHSTLVGTISGAMPLLAGYTAVSNRFDLTALLLALIMIFWQMPHFYAIGIFRQADYKAGGLPVWPVKKGVRNTQVWIMVYTALYVLAVLALAVFASAGWTFGGVLGLLGVYWLWRGLHGFRAEDPTKWARGMFGFSLITLLVLAGGLALAPLLP
ncbi:MAG TPA: heme o synthase [Candidatus Saccharimonadales bacterium]|nr:heme o synthase [Candidatus Saccharimonadales bacterium]